MKKSNLILLAAAVLLTAGTVQAQEEHETKWEVPELFEFHDVIYSIWHVGWPEKDVELLKSLIPDIEEGYKEVSEAELPGILRDKKPDWEENVEKMGEYLEKYKSAAAANDTSALLNAAENIHTSFENLVRTIRPVLPEVDAFHQELYKLYHYYVPDYDYEKIKASVNAMYPKVEALKNTELPERMKLRQAEFNEAVIKLEAALNELKGVINEGGEKEQVIGAVDKLHTQYQNLEAIFD